MFLKQLSTLLTSFFILQADSCKSFPFPRDSLPPCQMACPCGTANDAEWEADAVFCVQDTPLSVICIPVATKDRGLGRWSVAVPSLHFTLAAAWRLTRALGSSPPLWHCSGTVAGPIYCSLSWLSSTWIMRQSYLQGLLDCCSPPSEILIQ